MLSAFDPRMDNCAARNQIKVHTSNLSSIIEENISLRFSFEEYIIWLARTKLLGLAISNSSKTEVIMHRAAEVSFVRKQITVLIKFVTSRESSGITPYTLKRKRNRGNIFIESQYIIFTLKSFTEWQDAYNAFNFLEKQNLVKSHRLVLFNFFSPFSMFIWRWLTWLDMKILFYFLAIHHMDYAKLCSRRA